MPAINPYPALKPLQGGAPPTLGLPPVSMGEPSDDLLAAIVRAHRDLPPMAPEAPPAKTWMEQLPHGDWDVDPSMAAPLPTTGDGNLVLADPSALMQPQQNRGLDPGTPSPLALALMGMI